MICSIVECIRPVKTRGWCQMHYFRWRRHGDPEGRLPSGRKWCATVGCMALIGAMSTTGVCKKHYDQLLRWGGTPRFPERKHVSYQSAHQRVRKELGPASDHACTLCAGPAFHWAYSHLDANEVQSEWGPYSYQPWFFVPLCVPCHKRFDLHRACNSGKGAK